MKKEVAVFSGSFNPIHMGHLILANYIKEFTYVDEIWFIVSPQNPLKNTDCMLDDDIRLLMTQLALENFVEFKLSNIEFEMPSPSYTIYTLKELSKRYPNNNFTLIIGADNWVVFNQWKDYEELIKNYKIIIYPRKDADVIIQDNYKDSIKLVNAPLVDISSTFIRRSINEGRNMRAFLPPKVYDYISENNLYR